MPIVRRDRAHSIKKLRAFDGALDTEGGDVDAEMKIQILVRV